MLRITEFKGSHYPSGKIHGSTYFSNKWIRFEWDTGFLEIQKKKWDKLTKRMKNRILELGSK